MEWAPYSSSKMTLMRTGQQRLRNTPGGCLFNTMIGGLRLRPIAFIYLKTKTSFKCSYHSYVV